MLHSTFAIVSIYWGYRINNTTLKPYLGRTALASRKNDTGTGNRYRHYSFIYRVPVCVRYCTYTVHITLSVHTVKPYGTSTTDGGAVLARHTPHVSQRGFVRAVSCCEGSARGVVCQTVFLKMVVCVSRVYIYTRDISSTRQRGARGAPAHEALYM